MRSDGPSFGQADLSNCERELIHLAGSIQPHGVLLALDEPDLRIIQISANIQAHTGLEPASLLEQPLEALVPALTEIAPPETTKMRAPNADTSG